ncbi:Glucose receptor Git3 N-terminal domain-containing protein [Madurella fahalii]|uniref:Glucose receptor Git3 N-terminal domain-containing protein n=1 Tax=Madurella fahalii TaxID=1157608 RepID=A0ABQ0GMY2_9PEZI
MADHFVLDKESDDLVPLPVGHRQGLMAVTIFASLSFASSTAVLLYLTVKLVRWHLGRWREFRQPVEEPTSLPVDLSLGLAERHFAGDESKQRVSSTRKKAHPNQFLVLIYNLLLADIHQAGAFMLNVSWLGRNGIVIRTPVCWAQGWLVSTGDLSSSLFIGAIAIHTYLAVVWKYTLPQWVVYATVVALWVFNYFLFILGIVITRNGKDGGGFYVRAAGWCWINIRYENLRLHLHYLWIFITLALTSILYTLIFISLRKNRHRHPPHRHHLHTQTNPSQVRLPTTTTDDIYASSATYINANSNPDDSILSSPDEVLPVAANTNCNKAHSHEQTTTVSTVNATTIDRLETEDNNSNDTRPGGHHKAFLLYPVIYVICTAPLALGRIATMAGVDVPISYFCTAGALITSNGWLDVLLWGVTRHTLLFSSDVGAEESGLDTFTFMRTPAGRRYGNLVWVEGGASSGAGTGAGASTGTGYDQGRRHEEEKRGLWGKLFRWGERRRGMGMGWRVLGTGRGLAGGGGGGTGRRQGKERVKLPVGEEGLAIQMDMVTTVVVEAAEDRSSGPLGEANAAGVEGRGMDGSWSGHDRVHLRAKSSREYEAAGRFLTGEELIESLSR